MNHTGPWILPKMGPRLASTEALLIDEWPNCQAPLIDESPCQLGHTRRPGPLLPVQAVPGAATTLPKHDFSLAGLRLSAAQKTALSSWHDENSSSDTPYPSLSAEIISDLQERTVSCAPFLRRPRGHRDRTVLNFLVGIRESSLQGATESLITAYLSKGSIQQRRRYIRNKLKSPATASGLGPIRKKPRCGHGQ
jgi:hypothetical protein